MRQNSYTITLSLTASEQKLLNQIQRESSETMPTMDVAVYKLALDGVRAKLDAQRQVNKGKWNERHNGTVSQSGTKPQKSGRTSESAQ